MNTVREVVYEVRASFDDPTVKARYLAWLESGHLREVVVEGALEGEIREHEAQVISRYRFASPGAFAAYEAGAAIRLRAEGKALFPTGVHMERSVDGVVLREVRPPLEVIAVPCLKDNYAYLIVDREHRAAVVVDPSEAAPVEAALKRIGAELAQIWCTHHHFDHVGGNEDLLASRPGIPVLGSEHDAKEKRIPGLTRALSDGDEVLFAARSFRVLTIPGHTLGAIAYVGDGRAFTGDTLFTGGCGRVFEGTMPMMRASLMRLAALPKKTEIYPGHEYTVRNLEFAAMVEPAHDRTVGRLDAACALRAEGLFTVPSRLEDELSTNPFLRTDSPAVRAFAQKHGNADDEDQVFARLREAKDTF